MDRISNLCLAARPMPNIFKNTRPRCAYRSSGRGAGPYGRTSSRTGVYYHRFPAKRKLLVFPNACSKRRSGAGKWSSCTILIQAPAGIGMVSPVPNFILGCCAKTALCGALRKHTCTADRIGACQHTLISLFKTTASSDEST